MLSAAKDMKNNSADLRSFLFMLQNQNDLVRVSRDVNTEYEAAAVTARLDGGNAVLFENVKESKSRVICNVVGTPKRFYLALGGAIHQQFIESYIKKISICALRRRSIICRSLHGPKKAAYSKRTRLGVCTIFQLSHILKRTQGHLSPHQ